MSASNHDHNAKQAAKKRPHLLMLLALLALASVAAILVGLATLYVWDLLEDAGVIPPGL